MQTEQPEREKYAKRIEFRFHDPAVTAECLKQYDAMIAAQGRLSEYRQGREAQEALYRHMIATHRDDERKVEDARKTAESATRESERVTAALKEMRAHYAQAMQEVEKLQTRNDELVKEKLDIEDRYKDLEARYVDLVNSGKSMQDMFDALKAERDRLDDRVRHLQEQIMLGNKDKFGATTEKTSKLFDDDSGDADPLSEDMPESGEQTGRDDGTYDEDAVIAEEEHEDEQAEEQDAEAPGSSDNPGNYSAKAISDKIWALLTGGGKAGRAGKSEGNKDGKPKVEKKKWKRSAIYDSIADHVNIYNYDPDELDRLYGKGRWRFVSFDEKKTVGETRPHNYVKHEFTPVIAVKNPDGTESVIARQAESNICPHSFVSDSLFSSIAVKRYDMSLPINRIEKEYMSRGIPLSKETMCNWFLHFARGDFAPVYDRMWEWLNEHCTVQQCDETTWQVIVWKDDDDPEKQKANGAKGYVWVHTSGEFADGRKIILYSFEKSRSADHLRRHISSLVQYLVSDAYSAYGAIEDEREGLSVCYCWMHCRRAWARAVYVMEPGMSDIAIDELVKKREVQGLLLANAIFEADTPLKKLTADERKAKRLETVALRVDDFFGFVHSIDLDDPAVDGKLREAVIYSLNQEERLRVFLEDGSIPIDNGYVERCIRPIALSRRNSLFSYSEDGAESSMIMYTLVETAKANGADPYFYIKYLLNELPKYLDGKDRSFLDDMMPWSEKYRAYEREQLRIHADERVPESQEPPEWWRRAEAS